MECVCIPAGEGAFTKGLHLLEEEGLSLVAAVQECTNPKTGDTSLLFPIKKM